jgi:hypothetical protein
LPRSTHSLQSRILANPLNLANLWQRMLPSILVGLIFAILTVAVTYPIAFQLNSGLAQHPGWTQDSFHYVYVFWWLKKALLECHVNPANLNLIYYPAGGYYPLLLTFSTTYVLGLPLLPFLPPGTIYNISFLLTFFLSGLSAYALCAYLTRNRYAALLGGIVYAFFPGHLAHALTGHLAMISIYPFPLYLLFLFKTIERPRPATAFLCGTTLAASLLVRPEYATFLVAPVTLVWLLYEVLIPRRRIERRAVLALVCAFGLAALLVAPFLWPVLREQVEGQGEHLQAEGTVTYSADLLGIVSPSPLNPLLNALGLVPPYARSVVPTDWRIGDVMNYAGIVPLILSAVAVCKYRRKVEGWGILMLGAAVLSLGPLLKVGGHLVTTVADDIESAIVLPYASLMKLPLISLNRAPARLNVTMMLTVAVLSSYGMALVLGKIGDRWKSAIASAACLLTLGESLVIWPWPTIPLQSLTELPDLTRDADRPAVLNLPITSYEAKELSLLYQTRHGHPIFDGWVQRSLPIPGDASRFLEGLLHPSPERDIIPSTSIGARTAIARAEGVGHVFLFRQIVNDIETQMELLSAAFGPAQFVNGEVAVYKVPTGPTTIDELVYVLPTERWWPVEIWDGQPARWIPKSAELDLYSPREQEGILRFTALPASSLQRLRIDVNGTALPPLVIGDHTVYSTPAFTLQPGLNAISLHALEGCTRYVIDPRCTGPARAADAECNPHLHWDRCLSLLLQDIRFLPANAGPAKHLLNIEMDERVRFLGYDLEGSATLGGTLSLDMYWQALEPLKQDYTIFVHLIGPDRTLIAQHDAPPLDGLYPTSQWSAGDLFLHQATVVIPADALPGKYDLLVGMYTYPDIKRLPIASDRPYAQDGLIWLQGVEIEP